MFTHIDAAAPQRPFVFGVYVDDDDMYAGACWACCPCSCVRWLK